MRKTLLFTTLLLALTQLASGQTTSYKNILGKWEGVDDNNQTCTLEFLDSSHMAMSMRGSTPRSLMYSVDLTRNPVPMDLFRDPSTKAMALKCLIQLVDGNTLKWQVFMKGQRPDKIDEGSPGTIFVLKRKS